LGANLGAAAREGHALQGLLENSVSYQGMPSGIPQAVQIGYRFWPLLAKRMTKATSGKSTPSGVLLDIKP